MSSAANRPNPERAADARVDPESPVDRALLAYLNDPTPARQAALLEAARHSPESLAEIQEFLAADADLQQMVGSLGPLASGMLGDEPARNTTPIESLGRSPGVSALPDEFDGAAEPEENQTPPAAATEAAASRPGAPVPQAWISRMLIGISAAVLIAIGAAIWFLSPASEPASPLTAMKALAGKTKDDPARPRRSFVPDGDLWVPPVVTPGVWFYSFDEAGAGEGQLAPARLLDREGRQPLERAGRPIYAAGLREGSSRALLLAAGEGYSGPVLTTAIDNFCLEATFQPVAASVTMVVNNGNGGFNGFGLLMHDNGHPGRVTYMGLYGGIRFLDTNVDVKAGRTAHLAVVRAGGKTTVYLNGQAFPQGDVGPGAADGVFQIGQTAPFRGTIDDVRVWVFAPGKFQLSDLLVRAATSKP